MNQIYESIDRVISPNFWLEVTSIEQGDVSLNLAKHRKAIERWLAKLDPDKMERQLEATGEVSESYEIDEAGYRLVLQPVPKAAQDRGAPGLRPLGGAMAGEAVLIDDITPIRSTLVKKAKKYGSLPKAYVIAQLIDKPFADERDIRSALYGRSAVQYSVGRERAGPARWVRLPDGFFQRRDYVNTDVSGVLVAFNLEPWRLAASDLKLWVHPGASRPLPKKLPFPEVRLSMDGKDLLTSDKRHTPLQLLGLEDNWPGIHK